MKPENVVEHDHFFATGQDADDESGRVDACRLSDGTYIIWDVDADLTIESGSFEEARQIAAALANSKRTCREYS